MHSDIDWKAAPRSALWWAVDADGTAHWFNAPNVAPFTNFWFADMEKAPIFSHAGDWRESLTKRP